MSQMEIKLHPYCFFPVLHSCQEAQIKIPKDIPFCLFIHLSTALLKEDLGSSSCIKNWADVFRHRNLITH